MQAPGYNVFVLRKGINMSQRALADAAGVDHAAISRLESGESSGRRSSLEKIAKVLGVSYETLFAPAHMVEAAAANNRPVPVLMPGEVREWITGKLQLEDDRKYIDAELKRTSRHAFAVLAENEANPGLYAKGDHVIFDPRRRPTLGSTVFALDSAGRSYIGKFRPMPAQQGEIQFEVVPGDPMSFPIGSSRLDDLVVCGTMIELHRYF